MNNWDTFFNLEEKPLEERLRNIEKDINSDISLINTKIFSSNKHFLFRRDQSSSFVATLGNLRNIINESDKLRKLLSISYDSLTDWHLLVSKDDISIFNNRIQDSKIETGISHQHLNPNTIDKTVFEKNKFGITPHFQDVCERIINHIDYFKRSLFGILSSSNINLSPQIINNSIHELLNTLIFLRFVEDYQKFKGRSNINLKNIFQNLDNKTAYQLISETINDYDIKINGLLDISALKKIGPEINNTLIDCLDLLYRDNKQGQYEYDFNIIAEYVMGQIYEKYVSDILLYDQQSLFPEYNAYLKLQKDVGLHYTPEYIAEFLVDEILSNYPKSNWGNLKVGDLACGSGVFLRSFLLKLNKFRDESKGITENVLKNIIAIDKIPEAIKIAKLNIALTTFASIGKTRSGFNPKCLDSLENYRKITKEKLDIIWMNPPFKGIETQTDDEKNILSEILGPLRKKRPDISLGFLKIAFETLKDEGFLGIVLPASFLDSDSSKPLRKMLINNGDVRTICKLDEYSLFQRGETRIALLVHRKKTNMHSFSQTKTLYCKKLADRALREAEMEKYVTKPEWEIFRSDSGKWEEEWKLIPYQINKVLQRLKNNFPKLSHIFKIRQGIKTGNRKIFIIKDCSIFSSEVNILIPFADNKNCFMWQIHSDKRRLIYPYQDGEIIDENHFKENYLKTYEHLIKSKDKLEKRSGMKDRPFYALTRERERYNVQKIVSPPFGLPGDFAFDEKGIYLVIDGNYLIPEKSGWSDEKFFFYLSVLNSELFFKILMRSSRELKGGQYILGIQCLKGLPIPSFEKTNIDLRNNIIDFGNKAHSTGVIPSADSNFNDLVRRAYNLSLTEFNML